MPQLSAGLLMCRKQNDGLEYFLVHPGGPFYKNKDAGVWSLPKGMVDDGEEPFSTARREFMEETGITPNEPYYSLGTAVLKSGKVVHAWAFFGVWDESSGIKSNTFPLEWPPRSKKYIQVPEADRGAWMNFENASKAINPNQIIFLERAASLAEK